MNDEISYHERKFSDFIENFLKYEDFPYVDVIKGPKIFLERKKK